MEAVDQLLIFLDDGRTVATRMAAASFSEDETRVTSYGQVTSTGVRRLLEWVFAGQVRKGEAAELTKLKALVEI